MTSLGWQFKLTSPMLVMLNLKDQGDQGQGMKAIAGRGGIKMIEGGNQGQQKMTKRGGNGEEREERKKKNGNRED